MNDHSRIARKITIVLFLSQSLRSAGFIAAFTVNAIVGVELSGQKAMAGVPGAIDHSHMVAGGRPAVFMNPAGPLFGPVGGS